MIGLPCDGEIVTFRYNNGTWRTDGRTNRPNFYTVSQKSSTPNSWR